MMPITAYSKTFKRELDASQLESLFNEHPISNEIAFRDFVKVDIECPACNVTGGHYVREGISLTKGHKVKQAYFAFRDIEGNDSHQPFCDFYTGPGKQNLISNEGRIDFRKSNSLITRTIARMVCNGIAKEVFTQESIRNMRQWFLDLRQNGDFTFNLNPHMVGISRASIFRSERNNTQYIVDPIASKNEWFDIDKEVYQSLYFKFPFLKLDYQKNNHLYDIRLQSVIKKAKSIILKDSNVITFDRAILKEKYEQATQFALYIRSQEPILKTNLTYSISAVRNNNHLMALSALLLFISEWDSTLAQEKVNFLLQNDSAIDLNAGNVIGLNPFIHYSAWIIIKELNSLQKLYGQHIDFDDEFNSEKARLSKLYNISI